MIGAREQGYRSGLSIVKHIIDAHNGSVQVKQVWGASSFVLPLHRRAANHLPAVVSRVSTPVFFNRTGSLNLFTGAFRRQITFTFGVIFGE